MDISIPSGSCKRVINDKTIIVDDFEYTLVGTEWLKVRELSSEELSGLSLYQCHNIDSLKEYSQWVPVYHFIGFVACFLSIVLFYQLIKRLF